MGSALARHCLTPRRRRGGSFLQILQRTCAVVTTLAGLAALMLDAERCDRVAAILLPIKHLPRRIAIVGAYEIARGMQYIAREEQARAFGLFDELAPKFGVAGYYKALPEDLRKLLVAGCHFARGAFAMMRADDRALRESARVLEDCGLPLYAMVASQLRKLCCLNRGELGASRLHAERVEVYAAQAGSAWHVEFWEPAASIPYYLATRDVVALNRIERTVTDLAQHSPAMWRYRELARLAASLKEDAFRAQDEAELVRLAESFEPRELNGWTTMMAGVAMFYNDRGEHEKALGFCERALARMTDADRDYVMIFLQADLQAAYAEAGIGRVEQALSRIEGLLQRYRDGENALVLGLLYDCHARIALGAGRRATFHASQEEAIRWLRGTATPALVGMADRLAALGLPEPVSEHPPAAAGGACEFTSAGEDLEPTRIGRRVVP